MSGRKPAYETLRIVRDGVHAFRAHVEQVAWRSIAVSQPFARPWSALDEGRPRSVVTQEVDRLQGAREAAANDSDMRNRYGQIT